MCICDQGHLEVSRELGVGLGDAFWALQSRREAKEIGGFWWGFKSGLDLERKEQRC